MLKNYKNRCVKQGIKIIPIIGLDDQGIHNLDTFALSLVHMLKTNVVALITFLAYLHQ